MCLSRPNFGQGAAIDKVKEQEDEKRKKEKMHFTPLARSPTFKVWSGHLPRQFGGVEAYSIDQSTTALGRGVQVKHLPSAANLRPGSAPAARVLVSGRVGQGPASPESRITSR
jgi:hypothetical protein